MHPGYFVGARHDRAIGVRPLPRSARENADRKLPVGDGEQPKHTCVVLGRHSRALYRQRHASSRTCWMVHPRWMPSSLSRHLRREPKNLRRANQRVISRDKIMLRESSRGWRRTAPSSRPSSASPLPAAPAHTPYHPATHPPTSPHHTDRHVAAASPAAATGIRWRTPEIALQRQLPRAL